MRFSSVFVLTLTALSLILGAGAARSQDEKPNLRFDALGEPLPPGVLSRMGGLRLDLGSAVGSAFFSNDGKSIAVSPAHHPSFDPSRVGSVLGNFAFPELDALARTTPSAPA